MNRRYRILLAAAITAFALTPSAKAYTIERVDPAAASLSMPQGTGRPFTARFGGISWPANWDYAQWYMDGVLKQTQTIGGQTAESSFSCGFNSPGTVEVKVRAQWNTLGFNYWTDYLTWTVDVYAHPPVASRVSPPSPVTVYKGNTQSFTASGTDPLEKGAIERVEWYLDGVIKEDFEWEFPPPFPVEHTWSHTFETLGTYLVEAVFYEHYDRSAPGQAVWTVVVEDHSPSATIVTPSSPVTIVQGDKVTFIVKGTDPADDLRLCEVYLAEGDGPSEFQAHAAFGGPTSGSVAGWAHTFNTPGTYTVTLVPLDLAGNYGSPGVWTVVVLAHPGQAGLTGAVIELDARARAKGPLVGAKVDLTGPAGARTATTDGQGKFAVTELDPGTYTVNVSKTGYYAHSRSVSVAACETKDELFRLTPESLEPSAFDFTSPGGRHFIEGMPGNLSFAVIVAWNGSPGSVLFNVAGGWYTATITDLGEGKAQASLTIAAPATISAYSELKVRVTNGEGRRTTVNTGVYLYPLPPIIQKWYPDALTWLPSGPTLTYSASESLTIWDFQSADGRFSSSAGVGFERRLSFDPWAGTLNGSLGGFGGYDLEVEVSGVEVLGEGRLGLSGTMAIALAGLNAPTITPGWELSASGKAGIGAPVVHIIDAVFPPAAPVIAPVLEVPIVGDLIKALRLRVYLVAGGTLSGIYEGETGDCFLGTTSLSGSFTLGLEGQVVIKVKIWVWAAEAGVYAGLTGTPEFQICPSWEFKGLTVRAYVGVFASAFGFGFSKEVGMQIPLFGSEQQEEFMAISPMPDAGSDGVWRPIGASYLRWGQTNRLVYREPTARIMRQEAAPTAGFQEERIVENVSTLASPAVVCTDLETLILFSLHDPNNPWHAATDIGTLRQGDDQAWVLDRIAYDLAAEFEPKAIAVDCNRVLAAWLRVSGDISDTNEPEQVVPHLDVVAAWFDPDVGAWSTPEQLTSNTVGDLGALPVVMGATQGVLWIQNDANDVIPDANLGDRLMFAEWLGDTWAGPQILWSQQKSMLRCAFVADSAGEGHVVLTVDEDGDKDSKTDCELYRLSTVDGIWQAAIRLTTDEVEDTLPTLVAPNGVPICVWSADGTLTYSPLNEWNPEAVYAEQTLAGEAATLDGVTLPGGAAVAYTVQQGPSGIDMVASFYDAGLDRWSQPRQLTHDEHAETALSLTCDGNDLVISYLKTQTLRDDMDIEIDGEIHRLENMPQPGRTDLYILRYSLGNDLAIIPGSIIVDPPNPAVGTVATIKADVQNQGDLPLQDVQVAFYDGDPHNGAVAIGDSQVISGTLIAGGKQNVSVSWAVPSSESSHEIFVVVDPCLAVEDRDRSNNVLSVHTVLPDLAIETCRSTEVSSTTMALTARVVNTGVIPAETFDVSWRLGAAGGEEIGSSIIESLVGGGAHEATFMWDTEGHLNPGQHAQVFAVADSTGSVPEFDDINNVYSLSVFRPLVCPEGDLNADCRVDMSDFSLLAFWWSETGCGEPGWCGGADLNQDGKVNLADVAILTYHWLEGAGAGEEGGT